MSDIVGHLSPVNLSMLIETSRDILFLTLAFCALWLTIFMSWLLYYVIAIARDTESVLRQVRGAVEKVDELAHAVHEKVERSAASFTLIAQAFKELVMWGIKERVTKKKVPARKERDDE